MSPKVFESKNLKYKVHFKDHNPPHVHVEGPGAVVVLNLATGEIIENSGFSAVAVNQIRKEMFARQNELKEAWDEYQK